MPFANLLKCRLSEDLSNQNYIFDISIFKIDFRYWDFLMHCLVTENTSIKKSSNPIINIILRYKVWKFAIMMDVSTKFRRF